MGQIATTVEQSKHLIELGLNPTSADMTYKQVAHSLADKFEFELRVGLDVAIKDNLFSYRKGYVIPSWSLSALLRLIPFPELWQEMLAGMIVWRCKLTFMEDKTTYTSQPHNTEIEAVYDCVEWVLKNYYIK